MKNTGIPVEKRQKSVVILLHEFYERKHIDHGTGKLFHIALIYNRFE